jgi:cytochrome c oxidase assembly factor CtaG
MSIGSRLVLNALAWAVSIPVLNLLFTGFERHEILSLSETSVAFIAVALLLWAGLIYRNQVPSSLSIGRRIVYLVAYLVAMILLALCALWIAFLATFAIYGL